MATTSLTRCATEAAASLPSTVIQTGAMPNRKATVVPVAAHRCGRPRATRWVVRRDPTGEVSPRVREIAQEVGGRRRSPFDPLDRPLPAPPRRVLVGAGRG